MTTLRIASFFALSLAAVGCGPQQSSSFDSTSALKTPKTPKTTPTPPTPTTAGLSGTFTVTSSASCGGTFNVDDPSTIAATATTVTISQNGYEGEQDVFFTATIGDTIVRPTAADIALGATLVDRKIASYSDDGQGFVFKEYLYDISLTDAEGLAAGPFQTVELTAVSTGVSYEGTYNDGEDYHCSFVTST